MKPIGCKIRSSGSRGSYPTRRLFLNLVRGKAVPCLLQLWSTNDVNVEVVIKISNIGQLLVASRGRRTNPPIKNEIYFPIKFSRASF